MYGPNHRWIVLSLGVAAQASFSAMFSGLPVTGITMRADYHLSTAQLGLVLGCLGLGVAISEIAWGLLTDKYGDRRILLTGLISTGTLMALMALVPVRSMAALAACMLAAGALGGSVNGSSGRAVMTWFADGRRGFAMSVRQTAIPVGGALGVALLPWLAGAYGFALVYGVLAGFCLLTAAATWRWLPATEAGAVIRERAGSPLRRWDVWRLALATALLTVPQFAVLSFSSIFLHDVKGEGVALASLIVLIAQLGGGAARVWTGRLSDRGGDRRTWIKGIGVLIAVVMAGAAVLTHAPTPLTVAALALGGLLANAWHGLAYTEIAVMAGPGREGAALGLEGTTLFAAGFLTPVLIPIVLVATSSWTVVWALAALAPLLAVPLAPGSRRRPAVAEARA
ncbi:MFS transporter [Nonomuraea sp. bgisy101]|uniref:MFS transporter n=1 Tax=Nonomuraea sp. bgisy101 TaxID=3413784 RepID=UPI003D733FC0